MGRCCNVSVGADGGGSGCRRRLTTRCGRAARRVVGRQDRQCRWASVMVEYGKSGGVGVTAFRPTAGGEGRRKGGGVDLLVVWTACMYNGRIKCGLQNQSGHVVEKCGQVVKA